MIKEHKNWLFLTFAPGAFGHQLARCLMTSPNVHWYDHPSNGENPWTWNHFPVESGLNVSPNHFVRAFDVGHPYLWMDPKLVPSVGFYEEFLSTEHLFDAPYLKDYLDSGYLLVTAHDSPAFLRQHFPNSKIISIVVDNDDWPAVVKNHIEKSGNYRAFFDIDPNAPDDKVVWYRKTWRNTIRDWQQHKHNLSEEQWIEWTVKELQKIDASLHNGADYVFASKGRSNLDAIVDLHTALGLEYNQEHIQKVIDAFNLDARIRKYL